MGIPWGIPYTNTYIQYRTQPTVRLYCYVLVYESEGSQKAAAAAAASARRSTTHSAHSIAVATSVSSSGS